MPASPEVIYQIANLHEMMGNYKAAAKYFNYLVTKVGAVRRSAVRLAGAPTCPPALLLVGALSSRCRLTRVH